MLGHFTELVCIMFKLLAAFLATKLLQLALAVLEHLGILEAHEMVEDQACQVMF